MNINTPGDRLYVFILFCLLQVASVQAGTLDPRLVALTAEKSSTSSSVGVIPSRPLDPFAPRLDSAGRVQVYILPVARNAALPTFAEIAALGGVKIVVSVPLHVVQAWLPVSSLNALAALPEVGQITIPTYAMIPHPIGPATSPSSFSLSPPRIPPRGVASGLAIDADAVQAMQAIQLQALGALGTGIKVGVISGDNSGLATSQAAGYLPSTVFCVTNSNCNTPSPGNPAEGTAMLEEVHAMAPNASLGFCGPNTTVDFYNCYSDLVSWGANVIADDLGFPILDMFSIGTTNDGSFAYTIGQFTQTNPNVAFVSSAGNDAQDYFQEPYTASSACNIGGTHYPSCMDFGASTGGASNIFLPAEFLTTNTFIPILEWNDSLNTSPDKLVLYLINGSGTVLAMGAAGISSDDGRPGEALSYMPTANEIDYIVIACTSCSNPIAIKLLGWGDAGVLFGTFTSASIQSGQKVASGVLTTVAAGVSSQNPLGVDMESFSAIGPYFYGDYATGLNTLTKPDLLGVDSVIVSGAGGFNGGPGPNGTVFCGTSATSPNVGALIAALMSADPGKPATFYYNSLENTANQISIGSVPFNGCNNQGNGLITGYMPVNAGAGLAQGYAALQSFFTFPSTSMTAPIAVASGTTGNYTVPTNVAINFTAAVQAGTNQVSSSNCQWLATLFGQTTGTSLTGTTVAFTFQSINTYTVVADCPDNRGILAPPPFTNITITAQNIPAPTVAVSNVASTSFNATLSGHEPLTITATSSNSTVLPNTGISASSGCGTTTLSCSVSLTPANHANGSATVTLTATDQYGQKGNGSAQVSYTYTPPSSGGGGLGMFSLMALLICLRLKGAQYKWG